MPQYESIPRAYTPEPQNTASSDALISLQSSASDSNPQFTFTFEALRPNLFRTTFTSKDHPLPPHPSVSRPEKNLHPDIPKATSKASETCFQFKEVTATVNWSDAPLVSLYLDGSETPLYQDLPFRSYVADGTGIAHYTKYNKDTLHVGLGEKAAPMDLSNRHFILSATDCFGYDVYRTDPLYKHIPLLINATPESCVAMFSTSHSRGSWSIGSEIDGLWGRYKVYRQDHGGLEEYLIIGKTLKDVVRTYADLAGYPRLVPRWAFGYIAGGMKYSMLDDPRACDALAEFARKLKEHEIPCSAFQMSSGYTVAETEPKTRNVFTWNRHRFPDPKGFVESFHEQGIRLIANVKPYVLMNHPEYAKLDEQGALFIDPSSGKTAVTRLWSAGGGESGEGSHVDFTSTAGFKWWYDGVQGLRKVGIDGIWNDNNEYTIPNDNWQCKLDSVPESESRKDVGIWGRAFQTELMGKSSHDALVALEPSVRPFVLTRSATAGTMRYAASSWSGDNVTSWAGMKGANALSLNAGMSLLQACRLSASPPTPLFLPNIRSSATATTQPASKAPNPPPSFSSAGSNSEPTRPASP
jgi:alpha-glucosidase (family GH31 glycosyl hydrolase)